MNDSFYTFDFFLACRLGFFVPGFSWPEGELIQWPVLMIDADYLESLRSQQESLRPRNPPTSSQ